MEKPAIKNINLFINGITQEEMKLESDDLQLEYPIEMFTQGSPLISYGLLLSFSRFNQGKKVWERRIYL